MSELTKYIPKRSIRFNNMALSQLLNDKIAHRIVMINLQTIDIDSKVISVPYEDSDDPGEVQFEVLKYYKNEDTNKPYLCLDILGTSK